MKKMITIIGILVVIFISMLVYKYVILANSQVTIDDVNKIEEYISKIYCWKEVTGEALPKFKNINEAQDKWVWEVVKKNLEDYELSLDQIQDKAKEIFGNKFNKELKKEENGSFEFNEQNNKYVATEIQTDKEEDSFFINEINKKNGYEVEILEYLVDYSNYEQNQVIVKNLNGEEIAILDTQDTERKIIEVIKNNKEKFTRKKLILKYNNEQIYVQKIEG